MIEIIEKREKSPYRSRDKSPYRTRDKSPYRVDAEEKERLKLHRYVSTPAVHASVPIIEVIDTDHSSRSRPTHLTVNDVVRVRSNSTPNMHTEPVKRPVVTISDMLSSKTHRTSSRNGVLYFAYGSHFSPSHFRSDADLRYDCSARPVALAKLRGWRWIVSSRGVPNIVPRRHAYSSSRSRDRHSDDDVVYGLIYNLDYKDESKVDATFGYQEDGPVNLDTNLTEVAKRPFAQGLNLNNKRYERVEIVEWFTDASKEGISTSNGSMEAKCLLYVDESTEGKRYGDIWDDEADAVSASVSKAIEKYGLSKRWVERVMGEYGISVSTVTKIFSTSLTKPKEEHRRSRSEDRRRSRSRRSRRSYESDEEEDTIIETRITKTTVEGWDPLAGLGRSEFYREKWSPSRYISM